jgi:hypothetical protein
MADQPNAVGIHLLEPLALLVERTEGVEILVEALLQLDLSDHGHLREIGVARDVIAVRLGVDEVADRCLFLQALSSRRSRQRTASIGCCGESIMT